MPVKAGRPVSRLVPPSRNTSLPALPSSSSPNIPPEASLPDPSLRILLVFLGSLTCPRHHIPWSGQGISRTGLPTSWLQENFNMETVTINLFNLVAKTYISETITNIRQSDGNIHFLIPCL